MKAMVDVSAVPEFPAIAPPATSTPVTTIFVVMPGVASFCCGLPVLAIANAAALTSLTRPARAKPTAVGAMVLQPAFMPR